MTAADRTVFRIPISPRRNIRITGPFPITPAEWDQMYTILELFRPNLQTENPTAEVRS